MILCFKSEREGLCTLLSCWYATAGTSKTSAEGGENQPGPSGSSDPRHKPCLFGGARPANAVASVMPRSTTGRLDFRVLGKLVKLMPVKTFSIRKSNKYDCLLTISLFHGISGWVRKHLKCFA